MNDFFDPNATRVARVNPTTGLEISADYAGPSSNRHPIDLDKTVVEKQSTPLSNSNFLGEFHFPKHNTKKTDEITNLWKKEPQKSTFKWPQIGRNKCIGIIVCIAVVALPIGIKQYSLRTSKQIPAMTNDRFISSIHLPQNALKNRLYPFDNTQRVTLKYAIDRLLDGDFIGAEQSYRDLVKTTPNDLSLSTAVQILQKKNGQPH